MVIHVVLHTISHAQSRTSPIAGCRPPHRRQSRITAAAAAAAHHRRRHCCCCHQQWLQQLHQNPTLSPRPFSYIVFFELRAIAAEITGIVVIAGTLTADQPQRAVHMTILLLSPCHPACHLMGLSKGVRSRSGQSRKTTYLKTNNIDKRANIDPKKLRDMLTGVCQLSLLPPSLV